MSLAAPARAQAGGAAHGCGEVRLLIERAGGGAGASAHGGAVVLLRHAHAALLAAEGKVQVEAIEPVERALAEGEDALNQTESLMTQAPAAPQQACLTELIAGQRRAAARIKARLLLISHLDDLRACHAQAQIMLRSVSNDARGGDPQPAPTAPPLSALSPGELPDVRAAAVRALRAERCKEVARRLQAERRGGDELLVEFGPQQRARLSDVVERLGEAQRAAGAELLATRAERDKIRARWLRLLHGDRLRVFQEHPDALPGYEGKARGPLPASVIPRWHYQDADGRTETFLFRGSRLLHRSTGDARRS